MTDAFENETNYTVWENLSGNLGTLSILFQYTDFHNNFLAFVRKLFGPVMKRVGWEPKDGEGRNIALMVLLKRSFSAFK